MTDVRISDHALVRWLERCHGIDMDYFREALRAQVADACTAGVSSLQTDECIFVFRDGGLVTVLERAMRTKRRTPERFFVAEREAARVDREVRQLVSEESMLA